MKRLYSLSVGLIAIATSVMAINPVPTEKSPVTVEGNTTIPDGEVIILIKVLDNAGYSVDRDTIRNGKFHLSADLDDDETVVDMSLSCMAPGIPPMGRKLIGRRGAHIEVSALNKLIYTWPVKSDVPEQSEIDAYLTNSEELWNRFQQCFLMMDKASKESALTDEERKNKIKHYDDMRKAISDSIYARDIELLKTTAHTPIWFDQFISLARFGSNEPYFDDLVKLFRSLTDEERQSYKGRKLAAYMSPGATVGIGDPMVDSDLLDIEGRVRRLSEFKGKWILVDFWSGGCGPCIEAIPHLKRFAEKHKDVVEVVSINTDTDKMWRRSTEQFNVTGNNWNDPDGQTGMYLKYGCNAVPTFILIDPDGHVRFNHPGFGLGMFERLLRPYIYPKPDMTVESSDDTTMIKYPDYAGNETDDVLEIDSISVAPDYTSIHFHAYYIPNYWIRISPESFIVTADGTRYQMDRADGINPNEKFYMPESGEATFTLYFPPLPEGTKKIDFREGSWIISGIKLGMD